MAMLYDMTGSAFECCWEEYGAHHGQPTTTNPTGLETVSDHVLCGGGWYIAALSLRCPQCITDVPDIAYSNIAFRCVSGLYF